MDRKIGTSPNGTLSPVGSEGAGKGRKDLCWSTKIALDSSPLPIRVYLAQWGRGNKITLHLLKAAEKVSI